MSARKVVWLITVGITVLFCAAYGQIVEHFNTATHWRAWLFTLIGAASLSLVFLSGPLGSKKSVVLAIWIPAILMRLALFPTAHSDDLNRYLWEGKLVSQGLNPYAHTASSEEWLNQRDLYWEAMNHKDKATAYPPLSELAFGGIAMVAYHPLACKIIFVLADLLTLSALLILLRRRGMALTFAGFYAFNPVILMSYSAEGHFDSMMIAALVWALVAHEYGRTSIALILASLASGFKWIALPLIPFFAGGKLVRGAMVSMLILLLPCVYFWNSLPDVVLGLFDFGGTRNFNGPVYEVLLALGLSRWVGNLIVAFAFLFVLIWRWFVREHASVDSHLRWILGSLIVLSPTVHFWYLAWIIPFVCLRPSMPWMVFSLSGGVYFSVWTNVEEFGTWQLELWQHGIFWFPFLLACIYELWSTRGRVAFPYQYKGSSSDSITVVIPTINVANQLPSALASIACQSKAVAEVIVVDAGSSDETVAQAQAHEFPIIVINSALGRGQQIAKGMETATSEWVVVLHADAKLSPDSLAQITAATKNQPDVIGGALGQRFEGEQLELLPIEILNDLRGLFFRTAFGDQAQFFHRETALAQNLIPKQPLMEDVESSWRIRECGAFLFLGQPTQVCHRKWELKDWRRRFALVIRLVSRYKFARLKSRKATKALSIEMYRDYYSSSK